MSVSHGYSTIGGIEYGVCGEDKKDKIASHELGVSTGLCTCPSIDVNVSELGCHATDALEL